MRYLLQALCVVVVFNSCFFVTAKKALSKRTSLASQIKVALRHSKMRRYTASTKVLFMLGSHPRLTKKQRNKVRYHLANDLYNMGFYHPATFQWRLLVKDKAKGYVSKSLQKITFTAGVLGDDSLLQYAIHHGSLQHIPRSQRHKLYYYFGEFYMRKKQFRRAITYFARVRSSSTFFYKALYQIGLAHAELNNHQKAALVFDNLNNRRTDVTDSFKVAAIMGKARAYYQGKQWKQAIDSYFQVPKDSPFWHDTLLERSWALLRAGRLRSTLSNFQTLHSAYYKSYYQPESLLLRAIVYLYICKYYEMEKVLDLFNKIYRPVYDNVRKLVKSAFSTKAYYQSLLLTLDTKSAHTAYIKYPAPVARRILREGDVSAYHYYITNLKKERDVMHTLPVSWTRSRVGRHTARLLRKRLNISQKMAGQKVVAHLKKVRSELKDFFIQEQFIRYEMLRSKRGFLKKKIAKKNLKTVSIEDFGRSYYVQNGYEYWPFKGEYWLDELGNYHYVGRGSCSR